jgi:hypothetical protein
MIAVWEAIAARDAAHSSETEIMNCSACIRTAATGLVSSPRARPERWHVGPANRQPRWSWPSTPMEQPPADSCPTGPGSGGYATPPTFHHRSRHCGWMTNPSSRSPPDSLVSFVAQWHLPDVTWGPTTENGTPATHLWAPDRSAPQPAASRPPAASPSVKPAPATVEPGRGSPVGRYRPVLTAIMRSLSVMSSMNISTLRRRSIRALSMSNR